MQKRNSFTVYYLITRDHEKFFYKKDKSAHLVILTFPNNLETSNFNKRHKHTKNPQRLYQITANCSQLTTKLSNKY